MNFKDKFINEIHVTLTACLWLFSSVYTHMIYNMKIFCETLFTLAALIWSFSSVCPHMSFKIIKWCALTWIKPVFSLVSYRVITMSKLVYFLPNVSLAIYIILKYLYEKMTVILIFKLE